MWDYLVSGGCSKLILNNLGNASREIGPMVVVFQIWRWNVATAAPASHWTVKFRSWHPCRIFPGALRNVLLFPSHRSVFPAIRDINIPKTRVRAPLAAPMATAGQTRADCLVLRLYNVLLFRGVWLGCQLALLSTPLRVTHIVGWRCRSHPPAAASAQPPRRPRPAEKIQIPICCVDVRSLVCPRSLNTGHVHDLPGFPFTVILPIYDILDLYSFVELTPNVHRKAVSIRGPCKVASISTSSCSNSIVLAFCQRVWREKMSPPRVFNGAEIRHRQYHSRVLLQSLFLSHINANWDSWPLRSVHLFKRVGMRSRHSRLIWHC